MRLLIALLVLGLASLRAGPPAPAARIAPYLGDREAALSFTFDDGWEDAASLAAPLLEKHGLRGTFFIVPGVLADDTPPPVKNNYARVPWKRWRELAAAGHEIGNHSFDHGQHFTDLDDERLRHQINDAHDLIREKIGTASVSFALPSSNTLNEWTVAVISERHPFIRRQIVFYGGPKCTVESANAIVDKGLAQKKHIVPLLHAVVTGYDAFTSADILDQHLAYVATLRDRLWVDTFGNISRYVRERDAAKLEITRTGERSLRLLLTVPGLDPRVFNSPLTVVIPAPASNLATATREGIETPLLLTRRHEDLLLDLTPGPAPVHVHW